MAPPAKGKKRKQAAEGGDAAGPSSASHAAAAAAKASKKVKGGGKGKEPAPPTAPDSEDDDDEDDDESENDEEEEEEEEMWDDDAAADGGAPGEGGEEEDDLEGLVGEVLNGEIDDEAAANGASHSAVQVLREGFEPIAVEDERPPAGSSHPFAHPTQQLKSILRPRSTSSTLFLPARLFRWSPVSPPTSDRM